MSDFNKFTCCPEYRRPTIVCGIHWVITALVVLLFFFSYGLVFGLFRARGSDQQLVTLDDGDRLFPESVGYNVRVLSFVYGVSVTMQFSPVSFPPNFTTPDGRLFADSLGLQINGIKYSYAVGTVPGIIVQTIGYETGDSQDYPFDDYTAPVSVCGSKTQIRLD
jgi:hypothetical protein